MAVIKLLYFENCSQALSYLFHCLHGLIVEMSDQLARTRSTLRVFSNRYKKAA
ncbi:MAG: hypothetical protein H0X26_08545 [Alphaproteobacteria bacterium]|nr:hypothetical protein [Alphaproteobacteria bacterium]